MYCINDLIEQKKQILLKKKSITVDDIDSKKYNIYNK